MTTANGRDKCQVHWGAEIKQRERDKKSRGRGAAKGKLARKSQWQIVHERHAAERKKQEERFAIFAAALKKATFAKLDKLGSALPKPVFQQLLSELSLPRDSKPANLALALVAKKVKREFDDLNSYNEPNMVAWAKALGVDVKACEPPREKVQPSGAKKVAAKRKPKPKK